MTQEPAGDPESEFAVVSDANGVTCTWRNQSQRIEWDAIEEIAILTSDDGAVGIDVWLALTGSDQRCLVPDGASGSKDLLFKELKSRFPKMNWRMVSEAMSHTDVAKFVVWSNREL